MFPVFGMFLEWSWSGLECSSALGVVLEGLALFVGVYAGQNQRVQSVLQIEALKLCNFHESRVLPCVAYAARCNSAELRQ